jgi:hypothetical protein
MRTLKCALVGLVLGILTFEAAPPAAADESPFGYIYGADSYPKGKWEYEQWNTVRTGKAGGSYTAFDLRNEAEYGFTDRLQAAFYLNSSYLYSKDVPEPGDPVETLETRNEFKVNGVSLELKYQILNPFKDPLGLSLYVEPELGVRNPRTGDDTIERAVEFKAIFQKDFLEDRLIFASNIVFEPEWEREDGEQEKELKSEFSLGAAYRFAAGWYGGVECLNRRVFEDQKFDEQAASAWFLGPSVHYARQKWWATLTVLPQISGTPSSLGFDASGHEVTGGSRHLAEYEKMEIRLRFGIPFGA